ncbi:hypothetical protein CH380_16130 [Leptospira adleri]|nr:hypothetical protein CH380_16130 [Leptospira adleri]
MKKDMLFLFPDCVYRTILESFCVTKERSIFLRSLEKDADPIAGLFSQVERDLESTHSQSVDLWEFRQGDILLAK